LGRSGLALLFGSGANLVQAIPAYCAIGSGSGVLAVTNTHLITEVDRNAIGSRNVSVVNKVTFTTDFSSVEMSGIKLMEFGIFGSSVANGSVNMYNREGFGSLTFDGTNDLQVQVTFEIS